MAALPSPWRSPKGEAQYRAAYEAVLDLWPVPYEHRYVTGHYGRTHVVVAGPRDAPPLVLQDNLRDPIFNALDKRLGRLMYLSFRHFRVFKYWASQSIRPHVFPDEELRGMHVPMLLLIGEKESLYDPVRALQRAKGLVPNLEAELIPRANHSMTMEQHDVVDRRILAYLGSATTAAERVRTAARATVALS